jgi:hypothetical protein
MLFQATSAVALVYNDAFGIPVIRTVPMLSIRLATAKDTALLVTMIRELATFEHLEHEMGTTAEDLARDGFGPRPKFRAAIAQWNGEPAGYAMFFEFYSSFQGRAGLFLDDLFCPPCFSQTRHWHCSDQACCRYCVA